MTTNEVTDLLPLWRTRWVTRMVDSCVVKRVATNILNTTTGVYAPTYTTQYSGPCLVRPVSMAAPISDVNVGQRQAELKFYTVFVPYTEVNPLPDDLVDITSTYDGFLNGKQFVVRNVPGDTSVTVRRLECEEVVNG